MEPDPSMGNFSVEMNLTLDTNASGIAVSGPVVPSWIVTFDIVWIIVYTIEKVIGFCGNMLTVISISKFESLSEQPSNIFIASLAIADCTNILASPFECIIFCRLLDWTDPHDKQILGISCYLATLFGIISWYGNAFHICLIAFERFLSVNFPLKMLGKVTKGRAKKVCLILWILIIIKFAIDFVFFNNGMNFNYCQWQVVFQPLIYNNAIWLPFIIISCLTLLFYARIAYVAFMSSRESMVRHTLSSCSQQSSPQTM